MFKLISNFKTLGEQPQVIYSVSQLKATNHNNRCQKETLIEYAWRLISALDNRLPTFNEFFTIDFQFQMIFVSITPKNIMKKYSIQTFKQNIFTNSLEIFNKIKEKIVTKEKLKIFVKIKEKEL